METNPPKPAPAGRSLNQWLFNPFTYIAGLTSLLAGLAIIAVTAFIASLGQIHLDGPLDLHITPSANPVPLWLFFAEGLIDWLSLAILLFFLGLIVSKSSFRFIDVLGTQALARWPYLVAVIASLPSANRKVLAYLLAISTGSSSPTPAPLDFAVSAVAIALVLAMLAWMVILMYKAYGLSCNLKGPLAIVTFAVALIGAEVSSKVILMRLAAGMF